MTYGVIARHPHRAGVGQAHVVTGKEVEIACPQRLVDDGEVFARDLEWVGEHGASSPLGNGTPCGLPICSGTLHGTSVLCQRSTHGEMTSQMGEPKCVHMWCSAPTTKGAEGVERDEIRYLTVRWNDSILYLHL